jgi:hypothetical protein
MLAAGPGPISANRAAARLANGRGPRRLLRRASPGLGARALSLLG